MRWRTEDLQSCKEDCPYELVYQSESGTLGVELSDPKTDAPQILIETDLRSRKIIIDQELVNDLSALKQLSKDRECYIVNDDVDSMTWLVSLYSDIHSPQYWIWNRNHKKG